ncbi:hypothetical protein [Neobacillus drentensis]|uniref:hypothetical protein n=1 Tax=Neobacillus drentensis TaxID=220684 RepID=UPI000A9D52FA|nr:hypothetical protein [Neobacillus drentensis]
MVSHPYTQFENTTLWNLISKIIDDLVENDDIEEKTQREYIVGYIISKLIESSDGKKL